MIMETLEMERLEGGHLMDNKDAIYRAEKELTRIGYLLECSPGIYENKGLYKIYSDRCEWLLQIIVLAKKAVRKEQ